MNRTFLILTGIFSLIITINLISASDVSVWQGQYYTGTTFTTGTYEFNFTVYDALAGGNICYSNTTSLTTGSFGEWKTEQYNVSISCNNIIKDYFLNINIKGVDQTPRRRLIIFDYLRKNVDEITTGKLQTDSELIAPIINSTQVTANKITVNNNASILGVLETNNSLKIKQNMEYVNFDGEAIYSSFVQGQNAIVTDLPEIFNNSLVYLKIGSLINDYGYRVVYFDNITKQSLFTLSRNANGRASTIFNLMIIPENKTTNSSFNLCQGNYVDCESNEPDLLVYDDIESGGAIFSNENITADDTGFFNYLGSLINRITQLWVVDINATGNIETTQNVSAEYFKGDGSLLTNLSAGNGLTPVYLEGNLNATNPGYTTIFTLPLTPGKMNLIHIYLAQSSFTSGVAIQNRVIVNESGPSGMCNFVTQTAAGTQAVDNILVGTDSADTGVSGVGTNLDVPFINTVSCAVLADVNQKDLIVQFQSEQAANVTTHAGSYYTNAVD